MTQIQEAVKVLLGGGVVAHATETCYGLAVDVFQKAAVDKLYLLKGRAFDKPVSLLVFSLEQAMDYGEFSEKAQDLARQYWPGPLTIVVPRKKMLPVWVNPGVDCVGMRVSGNKKARELVEAFASPVTTTSANVSGQPSAYSVQDFEQQGLKPDFILDSGQLAGEVPSTVVRVIGAEVELLREGSIRLSA